MENIKIITAAIDRNASAHVLHADIHKSMSNNV
jgi:hypothetical protein